jgi:G3E family GTPase
MTTAYAPWPIAIVTGFLGSGKTTLIGRLLRDPDMTDTVVVVNEFGEVGLDHHLIKAATDGVILLPNGCLCCTIRQDVVQTLRDLQKSWLTGAIPDFRRVIIETTGLAEPAPLVASIGTHPMLAEAFALQSMTTVVDAEHGLARLGRSATNRNQICFADRLILAKCDLVDGEVIEMLESQLTRLNPLAPVGRSDKGVTPAFLFSRATAAITRSSLWCDTVVDHLEGISSVVLRPERQLAWPAFQSWLNALLETFGSRLMRIKGQLSFEGYLTPVIIQAVHHTFYPITEAHREENTPEFNFLVLLFEGDAPQGLQEAFGRLQINLTPPHEARSQ